jgi:NADH dehydrogenase
MWRKKKFSQSVVVLGAGFAGIECAKVLEKRLRRHADMHVALVDKENHTVFQPLLPEVAAASIAAHHIINPVRMHVPRVDFDCAEVDRIDFDEQKVYFKAPEGMELMPMPYTHLVFAIGTVPNMGIIPGMAAHGLPMKTVGDAHHLRNHALSRLEEAANIDDAALRRELLTFVTVGAGFSGVETCAELHDMLRSALRYYPELKGEKIHSVLVSSTDRVLPALSPSLSDYAAKRMRKNGIEVLLAKRTASVTARACFLNDKSEIATRTVISTVGDSPAPMVLQTPLEKERGRLAVDEFMRCKGRDNLWAMGDCAWVINAEDDGPCPPTAQFAARQGAQCAENIVRAIEGKPLQRFKFKQIGYLASLGHLSAVVEIGFIRLTGFVAWWVWRTIYLSKLPGWYRRLKVTIDWTVDLFFPRDIVQIAAARTDRVGRQHFEPGQVIVNQGDAGDTFFSVVAGEVEVTKTTSDGEKLVAQLGPGSYFGEEALLSGKPRNATVRAKTSVDLLCLGQSDFKALADNIAVLGKTFKAVRKPLTEIEAAHDEDVRAALKKQKVHSRMHDKLVTLNASDTLETMCRTFQQHGFALFPVLDDKRRLVGMLGRDELHHALNTGVDPKVATVGEIAGPEIVTALPDDDLCTTMDRFHQHEVERMAVVAPDQPTKLLGLISITDVLQARIEIELVLRNPDTAATLKLPHDVLDELHAQRKNGTSP